MEEKRLIALIANALRIPEQQVTRDSDLIEDLGADSLSVAVIAASIEEELGRSLPADELLHLLTVGDLLDTINEQPRETE